MVVEEVEELGEALVGESRYGCCGGGVSLVPFDGYGYGTLLRTSMVDELYRKV